MVSQEVIDALDLVRDVLSTSDASIVVVKNSQIIIKKTGNGIRPIMETIDELDNNMKGCIIGDRILGKASALLCRYANVTAVYSPQGTKTAIALLIIGGVACQVDEMIPYINNRDGTGLCPFEKMLEGITSPEKAYEILKNNIK
jgi:hypothetical protein